LYKSARPRIIANASNAASTPDFPKRSWVMPRTTNDWNEPEFEPTNEPWDFPLERRRKRRRTALTTTFVVIFFAGAAFTAGAGDLAANALQAGDACAQQANAPLASDDASCEAAQAAAPEPAPVAAAPEPEAAAAPVEAAPAEAAPAEAAPAEAAPATAEDTEPQASSLGSTVRAATPTSSATTAVASATTNEPEAATPETAVQPVLLKVAAPVRVPPAKWAPKQGAAAPEVEGNGTPIVWLNRALPDPTPAARRLSPAFASRLAATAKDAGVDWALMLGVLRADGGTGSTPASNASLSQLAGRLSSLESAHNEWGSALALDGHPEFADRALALSHYNRAVGLWALVHGLEAAKGQMTQRVLNDPSISIYPGGRSDLAAGRVDVRVVALIAYLRETFGEVTVSCLVSGHKLYARPGVVSAHIYGRAVDIADLGSSPILGNQEPGGLTEHGVRSVLLLPSELQPRQVISLLGLGGPSFPLANHFDHIHVGY
jgi:hypothetical protein